MVREAKELRQAARSTLSGHWGDAVVLSLVYMLIEIVACGSPELLNIPLGSNVISILMLPLTYGFYIVFLNNVKVENEGVSGYSISRMFDGFRDYGRILGTCLLMYVYVFLWSLLLLIPGIIKSLSYSMTFFILKDHPELKFNGAIELSMKMMKGHKFDLFYLCLTFIGWGILCLFTLGIGYLWLMPYMSMSMAHFYTDVKAEYEQAQA